MAGVGGQGIVLASDALAEVAMLAGWDVKKSDALGMAQRGGSVVSHIRLGDKVYSPMIEKGKADILLAFEKLEGARWIGHLAPGGIAIVNDQAILPLSVSSGAEAYPADDEIVGILKSRTERFFVAPGEAIARGLGNIRTLNMIMLGFLSTILPIDLEMWRECIPRYVPSRFLELNLRAFAEGRARAPEMVARLRPVGTTR
ncbi:MAG: indolepyruvate oxidoreductase subunit beta [Chloroflexi bacterium]|nr:indolepyruvate oxidoreductase subunit beta [Chloroflexota bacterium]